MNRTIRLLAVLAVAGMISGCSLTGTWNTVKTDPPELMEHAPFKMVTFNDQGEYSSTMERNGEMSTSTGAFTWNGFKLAITPTGGEMREYDGQMNVFTGQLILKHEHEGKKSTAWLEAVPEDGE